MNFSETNEELLGVIVNTSYLKSLEKWSDNLNLQFASRAGPETVSSDETPQDRVFKDFESKMKESLNQELDVMLTCFKNQKFKNIEKLVRILRAKEIDLFIFRNQHQAK